jgi:hypothetical protein
LLTPPLAARSCQEGSLGRVAALPILEEEPHGFVEVEELLFDGAAAR